MDLVVYSQTYRTRTPERQLDIYECLRRNLNHSGISHVVLFEPICHRYERKCLLVTSNQSFWEWDDIFPSGSLTAAAVDRLVHHCHIIGIMGESYRQKAAASRIASDSSVPPT